VISEEEISVGTGGETPTLLREMSELRKVKKERRMMRTQERPKMEVQSGGCFTNIIIAKVDSLY
jgi:hypothetical protein